MNDIDKFEGEFRFLSNFATSVIRFYHPNLGECRAATAEHAFQACKTADAIEAQQVLMCETPGRAKRMGRKVTIRADWEYMKVLQR